MNEKNLIPNEERTPSERRRNASKAGKASGKKRREQKTVREILSTILDGNAKGNAQFAKIATKLGVSDKKSVKDIFTLVCLLNSVKEGDLSDLERLSRLLGEENQKEQNNGILEELTEYLKND